MPLRRRGRDHERGNPAPVSTRSFRYTHLTSAQLRDAVLAAKPIQHDADFLLGRILLARRPANVSHDPLGRQFGGSGFLAHLHSSTVTMSQKSSFPQTLESVSQALTPDVAQPTTDLGRRLI